MWTLREPSSPGEILRRFATLLATSLLVASFVTVFASSTPVWAAPAQWDGDTLTYEDNQYVRDDSANLPAGTHEGHIPFIWVDQLAIPQEAHVIYFDTDQPQSETDAELVIYDHVPPDDYDNPTDAQTIDVTNSLTGNEGDNEEYGNTCDSSITKGIGWILCPVSNWVAEGVDGLYRILNDFLEVPAITANPDTGIYQLWAVLLAVANICFAVVFLIIIYSHLTSVGFSNYNIKTMLPRLLIAAVLVNLSFWICALAIDISNLLGHSVHSVFVNIRENMVTGADVDWSALTVFILSGGTVGAIAGFAAAAGGGGISLGFLLIAALAGVAFSVFVGFVILAARQAIITVLLILSPLAFVAFVLPSTQDLFNRWRKSFMTLLIFFPLFAVLFGGSGVAGAAIMNAADGRLHIALIGLATQFMPLVLTPLLIQFSSGLLGRIAGLANSSSRGLTDRAKNWAHDNADYHAANKRAKWAAHAENGNKRRLLNPAAMLGAQMDKGKRTRERGKGVSEGYLDSKAERDWQKRLNSPRSGLRGRSDRKFSQRYTDTHDLSEQAKTHKDRLDSAANEHWQRNLHNNPDYADLRGHRRETLLSKNRSDTLDNRMTAADQRLYDTSVANDRDYADIRQAKIESVSDTKHAQFQAEQVENLGERAYSRDFETGVAGSNELRSQYVRNEQMKKESATISNTLQEKASAHWERQSATDDGIKALRFEEASATDSHRMAAAEWTKIVEDVRLNGTKSAHVDPKATDVTSRVIKRAAGNIKAQSALAIVAEKAVNDIKTTYESRAQATYIDSDEGQLLSRTSIVAEKALADIKTTHESHAQAAYIEGAEGQTLSRRAQAAQDTLAGVQSEETAIVQEWRTEEGAKDLTGEQAAIAAELRTADINKRVYTRRNEQASDITAQEYAGLVKQDEVIPGTSEKIIAASAGIAGRSGEIMAKASAHQTIVGAAEKVITADTMLFSQIKEGSLLSDRIVDDEGNYTGDIGLGNDAILSEPTERIAALGSSIAKRHHMASHIKLWRRMGELEIAANDELRLAKASGNNDAIDIAKGKVSKVKDLQQQVMSDKAKTPFGVGDADKGDANVGTYSKNIFEETRKRIMTNFSVATMASMDPDDLRVIMEMASAGKLNNAEMAKISTTYKDWQVDSMHKSSIQDKHRKLLDPIQRHVDKGSRDKADYPDSSQYMDEIIKLGMNPEPTLRPADD